MDNQVIVLVEIWISRHKEESTDDVFKESLKSKDCIWVLVTHMKKVRRTFETTLLNPAEKIKGRLPRNDEI